MRSKLLKIISKLVDELSHDDFEGSTVRELIIDLERGLDDDA